MESIVGCPRYARFEGGEVCADMSRLLYQLPVWHSCLGVEEDAAAARASLEEQILAAKTGAGCVAEETPGWAAPVR